MYHPIPRSIKIPPIKDPTTPPRACDVQARVYKSLAPFNLSFLDYTHTIPSITTSIKAVDKEIITNKMITILIYFT